MSETATATEDRVLSRVKKNAAEELRLTVTEFGGHDLLDCRAYAVPPAGLPGEGKPTRKGLCLRPAVWRELLPLLELALHEFPEEA